MNFTLLRDRFTEHSTGGVLKTDKGRFVAYTLEDTRRSDSVKIAGRTCILPGRYKVVVTHSPKFKVLLPLLMNVPMFTGIRMHGGNTPDHTDGCILVGKVRGAAPDWIGQCAPALAEVIRLLHTSDTPEVFITIIEEPDALEAHFNR
jgi:hypothetical protein